ncbi:MAG: BtrH N-terminal domain-containing protein [Aureispira sp.]
MLTTTKEFDHLQTAHCENGVATNLLRHHGLDFMTEPLVFGLGSGLLYIHIPFLKVNHAPTVSFRSLPGSIFKNASKRLGIKVVHKKFNNKIKAQAFVDQQLEAGNLVGCQVGVFHLPYFPKAYRFHFNAHNLILYGQQNGQYLVSDPVMETVTELSAAELEDVRFARGAMAPKGHVYFPRTVPEITTPQIQKAIKTAIKKNAYLMTRVMFPFIGSSGFKYTAKQIRKWRDQYGAKTAGLYLGQFVRMQEEIGTGGGGFRFIYAAFLQEAAQYLQDDRLLESSQLATQSGDLLRQSAVRMAAVYKGRTTTQQDFEAVADGLDEVADLEYRLFDQLYKMKL